MKTFLTTLAIVCALSVGSTATAGVFVHAGPVSVGIGRPAVRHYWPHAYGVVRPVVARPVVAVPAPAIVPAPALTPYQRYLRRQAAANAIHNTIENAVEEGLQNAAN